MKRKIIQCLTFLSIVSLLLPPCYGQINSSPTYIPNPSNDFDNLYMEYLSMVDSLGNPIDSTYTKKVKKIQRGIRFWNTRASGASFQTYSANILDAWESDYFCHENEDYPNTSETAWESIPVDPYPTGNYSGSTTYGGGSGALMSVWAHPTNVNIIFVGGSSSGLWKTTNGGASWENLTDQTHLPGHGVRTISVNPNNLNEIMFTMRIERAGKQYNIGTFRTIDGGNNWELVDDLYDATDAKGVVDIKRFPNTPNRVLAIKPNKIYLSTDGGANFTLIQSTTACNSFYSFRRIDILGNNVCVAGTEFWYSSDSGNSFTNKTTYLPEMCSDITAADVQTIDVGSGKTFLSLKGLNTSIYSSTNFGTTWTLENSVNYFFMGTSAHVLEVTDQEHVYVGGIKLGQINTVTDVFTGHANNEYTDIGINYLHDDMRASAATKIGSVWHVFIATDGGLFKTTDQGQTWSLLTESIDVTEIFDISTTSRSKGVSVGTIDCGASLYLKGEEEWCNGLIASDSWNNVHNLEKDSKFIFRDYYSFGIFFNEECVSTGGNNVFEMNVASPTDLGGAWLVGRCPDYKDTESVYFSHKNIASINLNTQVSTVLADYSDICPLNIKPNCISLANNPHNPDELYATWNIAGAWEPNSVNISKGTRQESGDYTWNDISIHRSAAATPDSPTEIEAQWTIPKVIALNEDVKASLMVGLFKSSVVANGDLVYLSNNDGLTWVNKSYGLPEKFSVNDLVYQKGSHDRYYAATDVGVYYYDADHVDNGIVGKWKCLSYNLPNVIVSDLEIDYCQGKIYAGTFGRGLYELDLMPITEYSEFVVNQDETWDYFKEIYGNLRVESGNTLTITGELAMYGDGRLIVEEGAKLIVDGGTITSGCSDKKWEGIEVFGDNDLNQFGSNQGQVELKNGARIEHATLGVLLMGRAQSGDLEWGTAGGVLKADNSTFYNCRRGVAFMSYDNISPSGNPLRNFSYFKDCTFEFNDGYNDLYAESIYPVGISMWGVEGVRVEGCTFKNEMTTVNSPVHDKYDGHAIITVDASAEITPLMSNPPFGQTPQIVKRNSFSGFDLGVYSYGIDNTDILVIRDNIFNDNKLGVYADQSTNLSIVENQFTVPHLGVVSSGYEVRAAGVYLKETYDFEIEENTFIGTNDGNNYDGGFVIEDLEGDNLPHNQKLYRNTFNDLGFAVLAYGNNGGEHTQGSQTFISGLELKCNDFGQSTNNYQDVYVHQDASVLPEQGQPGASTEDPAGNRFSPNPAATSYGHIFMGQGALEIDPYVWHGQSQSTDPYLSSGDFVNREPSTYLFDKPLSCPTDIAQDDDGNDLISDFGEIEYIEGQVSVLKLNYTNVLNGGIRAEIMEVLLDDLSTSQEIRDELIQGSPYLDDEILIAAITRQIPLNQWHLTEVLVWNSRLSRTVLDVLAQEQPLTPYQYNLVLDTDGNSQRYLLELEIRKREKELRQAKSDYLLKAWTDETVNIYDEIIKLYEDNTDIESQSKVIDAHLKKTDFTKSDAIITGYVPLNSDDKFIEFYTLKSDLIKAGKNWFQMSADEIRDLDDIIAQDKYMVKAKAENVKRLIQEEFVTFTPKPINLNLPQTKQAYIGKPDDGFDLNDMIEVHYLQNDKDLVFVNTSSRAQYIIANSKGQILLEGELPKQVTTLNVGHLPQGIYHIKIQTVDNNTCDETFVIR